MCAARASKYCAHWDSRSVVLLLLELSVGLLKDPRLHTILTEPEGWGLKLGITKYIYILEDFLRFIPLYYEI